MSYYQSLDDGLNFALERDVCNKLVLLISSHE